MTMPGLLEVVAHGITALLATWLGLTVLTRSPRRLLARVFASITLLLVVWSVAIIIQRLRTPPRSAGRCTRLRSWPPSSCLRPPCKWPWP